MKNPLHAIIHLIDMIRNPDAIGNTNALENEFVNGSKIHSEPCPAMDSMELVDTVSSYSTYMLNLLNDGMFLKSMLTGSADSRPVGKC